MAGWEYPITAPGNNLDELKEPRISTGYQRRKIRTSANMGTCLSERLDLSKERILIRQ